MAYVAVVKAQFEYTAQDPETELSFSEDQILYVVEKEDDDWWKAKLKDEGGEEGPVGLVPATYVEEIPPISTTRALYAYESTSAEELSMDEDQLLHVFSVEEDWLLVRVDGGAETLGFVPRNYCEQMDESAGVQVEDAAQAAEEVEAAREAEEEAARQKEVQRQLKLKDKVETWGISEMDGRKKKKGTLGVGNGAVFFASDTDKMTPVKQYAITELSVVAQPSSKNIELSFSNLPEPLLFHCGSSDTTKAIIAKLEASKAAAGEALEMAEASQAVMSDGDDDYADTPAAEPKAVRWADPEDDEPAAAGSAATNGSSEVAKVLYDFDAQGDDELTVKENDVVTIVDKENDEWWLVRSSSGQEGVVPAQYCEIGDAADVSAPAAQGGYDSDEERQREEDEAAAAAAVEAERQRDQARKAEQRRAIERAAREKQAQEEHDRRLAEAIEQEEADKRANRAAKRDEQVRQERETEAERRREAARRMEPPKVSKRPSAQNVAKAAANLPTRGHAAPARPPDNDRPKPNPARTRVWSDKTGQFKVEAEYLGVKDKKIRLHKLNGVIIEVPVEKMSEEDVQLVRRHESRKSRAMSIQDDDDVPLGRSPRRQGSRSAETIGRESPMPSQSRTPPQQQEPPKQTRRKPPYDWFAFFLDAGVNMDDCTRYAARFERDSLDETLIPDLDGSTLRSLGLKEGDILRVKRVVDTKYAKKTPEQEAQIRADEDYARQLQEHEDGGSKGPPPQAPPGLFTKSDGKLANNTRRGRPDKKSSGPESVDSSAIAGAADALSRSTLNPSPPPVTISPAPEDKKAAQEKPANLITGFDDDAWTIKPSSSKPASPAPQSPSATAASVNTSPTAGTGTDSLLAQIHALRPANTGIVASQNTGSSFEQLAKMQGQARPVQQTQTGSSSGFSGPSPNQYGLGVQGSNMPMGQIQAQPSGSSMSSPNGARGPVAPIPSNQGLLNPMQPNMTGMFVPTSNSPNAQQQQMHMQPQQTGYMQQPQPTGYMQQQQSPMMAQPTGYAQGFQQGYGGPQQQQMQPNMTGYGGYQPAQNSAFNQIASMPQQPTGQPQQQPQNGDKFAPSNIFAAMKKNDFGKPEEQQPQNAGKYDALRPLATGYNGGPGMLQPQQTGYGMMPQMTGYANPQMGMGYMQGQNPYGQQHQQYR